MKNKTFTLLGLLCLTTSLMAQLPEFEWAAGIGGTGYDVGRSVAIDASGNVYTTGYFAGSVDFDPGSGTYNLSSNGYSDIFISKLDASGNFVWAKAMGRAGRYARGISIALDASGNVYTTGYFEGNVDFDPGSGTYYLYSNGNTDIFISKLDASGNFVWAKTMGSSSDDSGLSISLDASGNVYTTGYFLGTADFDPGSGTSNLSSNGDYDIFISKLDSSGNFIWAKAIGGSGDDTGRSLSIDASGNVYTTGSFGDTVDFDPGSGTYNLSSNGSYDIFILKLNASGNFVWAKAMGGSSGENGGSIALDVSGNVYTTGHFYGTADFDPGNGTYNLNSNGSADIFISKLDVSGNFVWAKAMGGSSGDYGKSIALDASGNVYTTGYFEDTADFDPGIGIYNLSSNGGQDIFISKLDASGNFVWAKAMGGSSGDYGNSIALDASGNVYTTGYFGGTVDFDPGSGIYNLSSNGNADIFISKLSQYLLASFTASDTVITLGDTIQFTDHSIANPTSWLWDFGDGTSDTLQDPTHIYQTGGTYTVSLVVSNSISTDTFVVQNYIQVNVLIIINTGTDVSCNGAFDGTIDLTITGGTLPYSFAWSNGATTQNLANLAAGLYFVTIIDANSQFNVFSYDIFEPDSFLITSIVTHISAPGSSDGSIDIIATGGTLPFSFLWSNGETTEDINNLGAGNLNVTATDANGCTASNNFEMVVSSPQFEWAAGMGGTGSDAGRSVAIDASGNVYTTGQFRGTVDFDPGSGIYNLSSNGGSDIFISKLDASGNFVWAKAMGGSDYDGGNSIALDAFGNVYTTGDFDGTADFDPGSGVYNLSSNGGDDIFISKLDASGNFVWAKAMGGIAWDFGYSIATDVFGNVYTTGTFQSTADFDPGNGIYNLSSNGGYDIFISKLDASGNFVWAKAMGGSSYDEGNSIALDAFGNVYTAGYFGNIVDFDPGSGTYNLSSNGGRDIFISKLDSSGSFVWAKAIDSSGDDSVFSLDLDASGNVYTTGYFGGTADFDPGSGTYNLSSNGSRDIFISKLDSTGNFVWAKAMGGISSDYGLSIALDVSGNVYTTGFFEGTADFDPNSGIYNLSSNGGYEIFMSKLDASGNFVWAKAMGGSNNDMGNSIALDASGNIYTTGYFMDTVDFDPGSGINYLSSNGYEDFFILKLSQYLSANFIASETVITLGDTIQFTDLTNRTPISWLWDFGDGQTSTVQNPDHVYQSTGMFTVSLIVTDTAETDTLIKTNYIAVGGPLVAQFLASDTLVFLGSPAVFTDLSIGSVVNWHWDFGDGTSSAQQNPAHTYQNLGTYSVSLIVADTLQSDTLVKLDYIIVETPFIANFEVSDTMIMVNHTIHFSDLSIGSPVSWHWDFGDGFTSTLQNPDHIYQNEGTYTVSLTVSNTFTSDSIEMINKIDVTPAGWYVSNTSSNHDVLIPENASLTIMGNPVSVGDYLGLFYDSLGTLACAGFTIWESATVAITVWGAEAGLTNGFAAGEPFKWKVYDVSAGAEYNALATYETMAFPNTGFFAANGLSGISTLEGIGYPDWEFVTNNTQHFIHIDGITPVAIAGSQVEPGDYIGVFYDSLGTKYCAGFTYWTGQNQVLIANGNNPLTSVKDGFLFGETFQWKIWKSSSSIEIDAIATYKQPPIFPNDSTFVTSGISGLLSLEATGLNYQYIDLPIGWSIFSSYMNAFNPGLDNLCSPFATEVIIAKDEDGQVYWPLWGLYAIGDILVGDGYQIKMASAQTMSVAGFAVVPENTPLVLEQGWSFLGYLRQSPAPLEAMLSPVVSSIKIVKNGSGLVYWPQFNLNLIGNMVPGQGYQINMLVPQVLTYPANSVIFTKSEIHHPQPKFFPQSKNTGSNMSLGIHSPDLAPGTEIGVFNQSGLLVGSAVVEGDFTAITLWGDDEMTPEIDGLMEGEAFLVRVYLDLSGLEKNLTGLEWIEGDDSYETNKISIANINHPDSYRDNNNFALFQNIPNPFTGETEISFYLPKDCAVEIQIFDLLGERIVETLHATSLPGKPTTLQKGKHSITFNSKNLPAGTYYYRLKTEGFEQTRKMVVMKY